MDLNETRQKLFSLLVKYRWYIFPAVFFVIVFLVIFSNQVMQQLQEGQQQQPTPTVIQGADGSETIDGVRYEGTDSHANINAYDDPETLISKQDVPDGILYTNKSPVEGKPNTTILTKDGTRTLFQRSVSDPQTPVSLEEYWELFGAPEYFVSGSVYFGPAANQYIYPTRGLSFVANPQTNDVLEVHTFSPTSINDYVERYGQDIIPGNAPTGVPQNDF